MVRFAPFLLALAACGSGTSAPTATPIAAPIVYNFPALTGRVVDKAELLPPDAEAAITAKLAELEQATGHQIVVVTLPSLGGQSIDDYGTRLGNVWKIGRKGANDGVVLIVAPNEKKTRIEVGRGLAAALTDSEAQRLIDVDMVPAFRDGDFPRGIAAGVDGLIVQIGSGAG